MLLTWETAARSLPLKARTYCTRMPATRMTRRSLRLKMAVTYIAAVERSTSYSRSDHGRSYAGSGDVPLSAPSHPQVCVQQGNIIRYSKKGLSVM